MLVIGGLPASALGNVLRGAAARSALGNPELLAKAVSGLVWAFAIVVAVNQIGIAAALVNILFMAVVSAVALALALGWRSAWAGVKLPRKSSAPGMKKASRIRKSWPAR